MPTVVIGTAGHIDHGKTSLLRALTGIDADRLPEERERGMTIDVGYAHLDLVDGSSLDFVDVPGHDRLVGNMLVGAGEIDAALLVVAADDGPRAQTLEHLELLDALGVRDGIAVVTKVDIVDAGQVAAVVAAVQALLSRTSLAGIPLVTASATTREGIDDVREALVALQGRVAVRALTRSPGPVRLAVDRVFAVRGRGVVVTGSLRGGSLATGERLRVVPGAAEVRIREIQVHNAPRDRHDGGRTALNLAGIEEGGLERGAALTAGAGIETSDRVLVALRPSLALGAAGRGDARRRLPADGSRLRLHIGTAQVGAVVGRRGRDAVDLPDGTSTAVLRLEAPIATFVGDRGVLRRPSPGEAVAGVRVLDPHPPRGISRRRVTPERLASLAVAIDDGDADAATDALRSLHGALAAERIAATVAAMRAPGVELAGTPPARAGLVLAADIVERLEAEAESRVAAHHAANPGSAGLALPELRTGVGLVLKRLATIDRSLAVEAPKSIDRLVTTLIERGRLARDGDRIRDPRRAAGPSAELAAAMTRLEAALSVPAPPTLDTAAALAGCPPEGVNALVASGRITRLGPDLAWATPTFHALARQALELARQSPLTPASYRDATGTSRRYVLAILEDLDRRGILKRTPEGHVPGPRAPRPGPNE